ncbi:MAG: 4a-hydroxytetrahydrobiopterin dehydratase [Dehalococcoidia bacterium]
MTTFRYPLEMAARPEGPFVTLDAVVDTSAFYTWVPASILRGLGVPPAFKRRFKIANGAIIEKDVGEVVVRIDGQPEHTLCVFGDEGSEALLGSWALEGFALAVDPVNRRLVPIPTLPMLAAGAPDLASRRCLLCEGGTPPLTEGHARAYLAHLADGGWELLDGKKIVKAFRLQSFRQAIAFVVRVADLAEDQGHHPDIWISWRRVRLELTPHAIGGLSDNDFIMAAKIDAIATQIWGVPQRLSEKTSAKRGLGR